MALYMGMAEDEILIINPFEISFNGELTMDNLPNKDFNTGWNIQPTYSFSFKAVCVLPQTLPE